MLSHIRGKINWQNIKLTQIFSSKGGGNSENVRCAVPASAQGIFSSGIKYMMSITATGNKYRFSTLRTSNTPDVTLSSKVLRGSVSSLPHHVTTLPLQKPSSLCATYPGSAPQKFSSISIFNPPCAPRDLVDSVSVLSSVLCKIVMLLGHPVLIISFKEHNNTITRSCKAAR